MPGRAEKEIFGNEEEDISICDISGRHEPEYQSLHDDWTDVVSFNSIFRKTQTDIDSALE